MSKKLTPQRECAEPLSDFVRKLPSARYCIVLALLALCLMGFEATAFGQAACFSQCQQTLAGCLQGSGGDPLAEARCQDKYDDCTEGCLIQ